MKHAIVTGSSGLIGSQSVSFLIDKGYNVIGIDNHMREYFFGQIASTKFETKKLIDFHKNKFEHYKVDIRNYDEVESIFKKYSKSTDIIIHTAAQPSHDWASREPITDFTINSLGTLNLLELTRKYCKNASFIFTSTNKVYGDNPNKIEFIEEEFRFSPKNINQQSVSESMSIDNCTHSIFGVSKASADLMVQEYGKYFGMNTVCFRGGCLTGPGHAGAELHGFLSYLIKCIVNKKKYTIYGYKGKQVRDNIHSSDLVNMFWLFHKNPKMGEVYNVGGGIENSISILEAISLVNYVCEQKINNWENWNLFEFDEKNRVGDHIYYVTNLNKFKAHFPNWEGIKFKLKDIIVEMTENEIEKTFGKQN